MENKDAPAFVIGDSQGALATGLSKREYFAGLAMQGLCAPFMPAKENSNCVAESRFKAQMAVRLADALLAELGKDTP